MNNLSFRRVSLLLWMLLAILMIPFKMANASAPGVTITTPTQNQEFSNVTSITVSGKSTVIVDQCNRQTGVAIHLNIDNKGFNKVTGVDAGDSVSWTASLTGLGLGTHTVQAESRSRDCNGALSDFFSSTITFYIKRNPSISVSLSPSDSTLKTGQVIILAQAVLTSGEVESGEHLELVLSLDDSIIQPVHTSTTTPLSVNETVVLPVGIHTVKAVGRLTDDTGKTIGIPDSKTSTLRIPEVDITGLYPPNGSTITADHITLTAQAESKFGGVLPDERLELQLVFDSTEYIFTSTTTPLSATQTVKLTVGPHTVTANARLVKTATREVLATSTPRTSTFNVLFTEACDGDVCKITDKNSSVTVNGFSSPGIIDDGTGYNKKTAGGLTWTVDNVQRMFSQWHWFRLPNSTREIAVGDPLEHYVDTAFTENNVSKDIVLKYSGFNFPIDIEIQYYLQGGGDSGFSILGYTVFITNMTSTPLDVVWFIYNDLDLSAGGLQDTIKAIIPDKAVVKQTVPCAVPNINPRLTVTDEQSIPSNVYAPNAFALDMIEGHSVENGGRETVLYKLTDNTMTDFVGFHGPNGEIAGDRIYAKQYTFKGIPPGEKQEISGELRMAPFARGDLNCDGELVFSTDYPVFLKLFGQRVNPPGLEPDYNGDGVVGLADYVAFRSLFKK